MDVEYNAGIQLGPFSRAVSAKNEQCNGFPSEVVLYLFNHSIIICFSVANTLSARIFSIQKVALTKDEWRYIHKYLILSICINVGVEKWNKTASIFILFLVL